MLIDNKDISVPKIAGQYKSNNNSQLIALSVTKMAGEYILLINFLNQDYTEEDE